MNKGQLLIVNIGKEKTIEVYEDGRLIKIINNVIIGKNGLTEANNKKEGDKKTPIGLFNLGISFGIHKLNINYPYIKIQDNDYWVDDINSKYYNYFVRIGDVIPSFGYSYIKSINFSDFLTAEHLINFKTFYEYAVFIEYNIQSTKCKGSALFLHCKSNNNYTSGCIAVSKRDMEFIINFININKNPKILIQNIK